MAAKDTLAKDVDKIVDRLMTKVGKAMKPLAKERDRAEAKLAKAETRAERTKAATAKKLKRLADRVAELRTKIKDIKAGKKAKGAKPGRKSKAAIKVTEALLEAVKSTPEAPAPKRRGRKPKVVLTKAPEPSALAVPAVDTEAGTEFETPVAATP